VAYYVLERGGTELYAMNMTLSEEEARRDGLEGKTVPLKAILVWTGLARIKRFRDFLSVTQHEADTPFRGLVDDMRAGRVDAIALDAGRLRDRLRDRLRGQLVAGYVAVDPGPEQRVQMVEEFRANLPA
jgi:hypothetical protein